MRQVMYQLNRYTKCLRERYHVPIKTAQIVRSSRNDLPCGDRAVAEVLGVPTPFLNSDRPATSSG